MSDIVSGVLKQTFGFLANKIRKEVAERLKDGDVTDEECRRLIVRELDDIKSKLDGLARKDLLSSFCFLQEGINGLYQSQLELPSHENTVESNERALSSGTTGPDPSSAVNEAVALINAVASLTLHSSVHFKSAIESFKLAREKATEAFCNEALSIEDRIQASQIRMMARILEKLEHPDASVRYCIQYLQELHDVGAIRKIYSILIDGGLKSWFNQTMHLNIVSSVQNMNAILFNFAQKFARLTVGRFDWPTISTSQETYNPLFGEKRDALVGKIERTGVQLSSVCSDFTFDNNISPQHCVINSKGEIVAKLLDTNTIKTFNRSGENRTLCEVPVEEHATKCFVAAMDIDAEDNIYVITAFRQSNGQYWSFKLFIFDVTGNKKLETPLFFHQSIPNPIVRMAINKDGRIGIFNLMPIILYIGNACVNSNSYEVKQIFHVPHLHSDNAMCTNLQISDVNGTKIIVNDFHTVYIYAENGQWEGGIELPYERGSINSLAIDHTTKGIVVKSYSKSSQTPSLLICSETGQLLQSLNLDFSKWGEDTKLTSHPNGVVVLVSETEAMLVKGTLK